MKKYLVAYSIFLVAVLWFSYLFIDPNFPHQIAPLYAFSLWNRSLTTFFSVCLILLSFLFYIKWLQLVKQKKVAINTFKKLLLVTALILAFSYPAFSNDIFNYIATAKVAFIYKENPYIIMPIEIKNEPLLQFMHAANKTALYGPVWILFTGVPLLLGLGNLLLTMFSFKVLVILFYFATCFLLWRMTNKNLFLVSLFACNPLVLIETIINGHNDIVMIFLFLFAIDLLRKKRIVLSFALLLASIFIKFASVFLVPVFLYIAILQLLGRKVVWENVYWLMFLGMLLIFLLSPLREEMYPWYAQWFLVFIPFLSHKKLVTYVSLVLSFALLLRYLPFLYLRTHFESTPVLRILLVLIPLIISIFFWLSHKKRITAFLT